MIKSGFSELKGSASLLLKQCGADLFNSNETPTLHADTGANMPIFIDADRAFLAEMRAITTDSHGQEVLVGLSVEETAFYMNFAHQRTEGRGDSAATDRYLELHDKHERARLSVLGAENQLRNDKPVRH